MLDAVYMQRWVVLEVSERAVNAASVKKYCLEKGRSFLCQKVAKSV